ncbi:MAG: KOW domain-containing RNA-binding protein [Defluviitaleaceae bacterium]|nr:KOW domain-containing RNA-binding protein [Defluviitaleaceae bacterium]
MDLQIGQIVFSKAGKDRGCAFIVVGVDSEKGSEYALLVDGKSRRVENPKRKKAKHLQPTNIVDAGIVQLITSQTQLKDADFRTALKRWNKEECSHG